MSPQNAIEFLKLEIEDEWDRLLKESSQFSSAEFMWQPSSRLHSIGWHVRHVVEWRYALIHIWICRQALDEALYCLGWEDEPIVQAISRNRGWHEPSFSVLQDLRMLERVRAVTRRDIATMDPQRYSESVSFPWRSNTVLAEISQDLRHSALHRGQIRQLKTMYAQRDGLTREGADLRLRSLTASRYLAQDYHGQDSPFQPGNIEAQ